MPPTPQTLSCRGRAREASHSAPGRVEILNSNFVGAPACRPRPCEEGGLLSRHRYPGTCLCTESGDPYLSGWAVLCSEALERVILQNVQVGGQLCACSQGPTVTTLGHCQSPGHTVSREYGRDNNNHERGLWYSSPGILIRACLCTQSCCLQTPGLSRGQSWMVARWLSVAPKERSHQESAPWRRHLAWQLKTKQCLPVQ